MNRHGTSIRIYYYSDFPVREAQDNAAKVKLFENFVNSGSPVAKCPRLSGRTFPWKTSRVIHNGLIMCRTSSHGVSQPFYEVFYEVLLRSKE